MKKTALVILALLVISGPAFAQDADPFKVFYFGNSFCENSLPWFHPTLAKSAGKEMAVQTQFGPGWQIWMHVRTFYDTPERSKKTIREGDFDAVVIHHFGSHPMLKDNMQTSVFNGQKPFPEPRDVSDFGSASHIIDTYLSNHPDRGKIFIYNSWPYIPGANEFKKRVADEVKASLEEEGLERDEILKKVKETKPTLEQMAPLFEAYDYESVWLAKYKPNYEVHWQSEHAHSRDYVWQLMDLLKDKYPNLWKEKRLALIPNGDVFLALDRKMKAGKVPGITNIGFYSRDGGHVRAGLPRYTLAATCIAVMFGIHPEELDYSIYNDLEHYENKNVKKQYGVIGSAYVHQPDLGELLEITPERAQIVNDTIWEVVKDHPYTNLSK